jgi:hypothetical protein
VARTRLRARAGRERQRGAADARPPALDVGGREATIVLAAVAPCAAVVLGALDVLKDSTALWLAVWLGVGTLAVQGLRYARIEQLGGLATLAVIGPNLALGLMIVALKVAVS